VLCGERGGSGGGCGHFIMRVRWVVLSLDLETKLLGLGYIHAIGNSYGGQWGRWGVGKEVVVVVGMAVR
jgi:hypothetical protein